MLKENRVKRVLDALKEMGLSQMLIVDPMSIYYLTGVYIAPFERFYALYLRADGKHVYFLNKLFTVPEEVGVEKVWQPRLWRSIWITIRHWAWIRI